MALENELEERFPLPRNMAAIRTEKYKRYIYIIIIITDEWDL